ncbi:MAG TPA: YfiR family protein [Terracidiphilus sp.]|jgi:hypothetical protein|nr:YfiR family protein [Terracidiphilus sp.]
MRPEDVTGRFSQRPQQAIPRGTRLLMRIIAVGAWTLLSVASLVAQQAGHSEFQIKAAYLYNFGKFVKWPPDTPANQNGSFIICVLDQDPFGVTLQSALAGESVGGKPVAIKRLSRAQDAATCHILFINSAQSKDLAGILAAVDDSSVLTVSDIRDFSKRGGMIQFVLDGNRIRFEINLESAQKSRLVLASELLKVAVAVKKPERSGD